MVSIELKSPMTAASSSLFMTNKSWCRRSSLFKCPNGVFPLRTTKYKVHRYKQTSATILTAIGVVNKRGVGNKNKP